MTDSSSSLQSEHTTPPVLLRGLFEGALPRGWGSFFCTPGIQVHLSAVAHALASAERLAGGETAYAPARAQIFRAFELTAPDDIRAIVVSTEPGARGTGLLYEGTRALQDIGAQLRREGIRAEHPESLEPWAARGVLLLNLALTSPRGSGQNHMTMWAPFMARLVQFITSHCPQAPWLVWGGAPSKIVKRLVGARSPIFCCGSPRAMRTPAGPHGGSRAPPPFRGSGVFTLAGGDWSL